MKNGIDKNIQHDWQAPLKNRLLHNTSIIVLSLTAATHVNAQTTAPNVFDEIVVTAQKRTENLQDVPISVQALGGGRLDDLGIANFDEVAALVPSVSITSLGPGNAQVYMRGIANGGDGNPSGSNPSVAVYLDDQPVTAIDRILDVHMYDIARVEALAGPQGTLYGASSQAGTLKIITNPPDPSAYAAGYDVDISQTEKGDMSYSLEGFVNIPISDRMALRLVGWTMEAGGYIDNVLASRQFNPGGVDGIRYEGPTISNAAYVEDDFNEETNHGLRAALRVDLDDNWVANLRILHQRQETEGVWDHDPEGTGDLQVSRFFVDESEDEFTQAALTIEGTVGDIDLIYAGSYLDRDVEYQIDYSEYVNYSDYIGYYTCYYEPGYVCRDPRIQYYGPATY
ncbi:MAG: TonB-dependent receptor plug domain-containing protein, partial [Alphaproteobacteria bacterium]|nr:TonB-dependent receptor plug domain-containing protein [Alphaproteobacteria bacterium]